MSYLTKLYDVEAFFYFIQAESHMRKQAKFINNHFQNLDLVDLLTSGLICVKQSKKISNDKELIQSDPTSRP